MPWGETLVEQKVADFSTPYQFNGKELDAVTGLYNYGARYYDPSLSIWMGVDPLADDPQNIDWNPYHYVHNNPINMIDPTGMKADSSYTVDQNGVYTNVGDVGGDNFDVIQPVHTHSDGSQSVNGEAFVQENPTFPNFYFGSPQRGILALTGTGVAETMDGTNDPIFQLLSAGPVWKFAGSMTDDLAVLGIKNRVPAGEAWTNLATGVSQRGGTFFSKTSQYLKAKIDDLVDWTKFSTSRGNPTRFDQLPDDGVRSLIENGAKKMKDTMDNF